MRDGQPVWRVLVIWLALGLASWLICGGIMVAIVYGFVYWSRFFK
jgi:hypothetical protein